MKAHTTSFIELQSIPNYAIACHAKQSYSVKNFNKYLSVIVKISNKNKGSVWRETPCIFLNKLVAIATLVSYAQIVHFDDTITALIL